MTKKYYEILEELDSKLSEIIDKLEDQILDQEEWKDEESVIDMIDSLEEIRGVINEN